MPYGGGQSRQSLDPHGYQPLVIDENVLTEEDRMEVVTMPTVHPHDWVGYLTRSEIEAFKNEIKRIEKNRSPYWFGPAELPAVEEIKFAMILLSISRRFARDKYGRGHRIWFGDGFPCERLGG